LLFRRKPQKQSRGLTRQRQTYRALATKGFAVLFCPMPRKRHLAWRLTVLRTRSRKARGGSEIAFSAQAAKAISWFDASAANLSSPRN